MEDKLRLILQKYLVASYAYYALDETIMPDTQYDAMAKALLAGYDLFTHRHKHLVTKSDLEAGTLFALHSSRYPLIVRGAALQEIERLRAA